MLGQLRQALHTHLLPRRHTGLLVALIVTLGARPLIGTAGVAPLVFSIALLSVLLVALYTVQVDELVGERDLLVRQKRRISRIGWVLTVPAVFERVLVMIAPSNWVYQLGTIFWWLVFAFVTLNQLGNLLKQKQVTGETISMAVSVYLLLGLTWGLFYVVIFLYQPLAFNLGASLGGGAPNLQIFPVLIYFSLTALSTVGYGDITPVSLQARYAAVAEGITGQFYLAILVARLVAMQMSGTTQESRSK
jgi:voltage-gated potassium channel